MAIGGSGPSGSVLQAKMGRQRCWVSSLFTERVFRLDTDIPAGTTRSFMETIYSIRSLVIRERLM